MNYKNADIRISPLKISFWKWSKGIDQQLFFSAIILLIFSGILVTTASQAVASRIGISENYFSIRHLINVSIGFLMMIFFSNLSIYSLKKIVILAFITNIILLILVNFYGVEVKGSRRWINIFGFSMQPSEFIKPFFSIICAYIFCSIKNNYKSFILSFLIYLLSVSLLVLQPDLGMVITLSMIYAFILFAAEIPLVIVFIFSIIGIVGMFFAYNYLPHVAHRIDSFLNPGNFENYQVSKSLLAFKNGSFFGKGPGEGEIKQSLPDSHTDFIFAVAGEEFGAIFCISVALIFAFIVIKTLYKISKENDIFIFISVVGIVVQLGIQSLINISVSLNLLPTKGMTLPFISYGGSSTIAVCIAFGILLSLLKSSSKTMFDKKFAFRR